MPTYRTATFYPKRITVDDVTEAGTVVEPSYCSFMQGDGISFKIANGEPGNYIGKGSFAKTYLIDGHGWLDEDAASFCKTRMLPGIEKGEHIIGKRQPCFRHVKVAALKMFSNGVPLDSLRQAERGDGQCWGEVSRVAETARDEFRTLAYANGANGHAPRPYALGWVEDGDQAHPAVLMEYLGNAVLDSENDVSDVGKQIYTVGELRSALIQLSSYQRARIAAEAAIKLGEAVRNLHRSGIIHRDLSTANIFFLVQRSGSNLEVRRSILIDLGNSKRGYDGGVSLVYTPQNPSTPDANTQNNRSKSPVKLTTLGFGAPEVITWWADWNTWSRRIDTKTDCFSVAAILYYLFKGDPVPWFVSQALLNRGANYWTDTDLSSIYPADGYSLSLSEDDSDLAETLNLVVSECTIRNPEYRRDLDWLLATLWNVVHPDITPEDPRHHSYSVISSYRPAPHDPLCAENDFDPLAYLCDRNQFSKDYWHQYGTSGTHGTVSERHGQYAGNATQPFSQEHVPVDNSFGPIRNVSVSNAIPMRVFVPKRPVKRDPGEVAPASTHELLSHNEATSITIDYARLARQYIPSKKASYMHDTAMGHLANQDFEGAERCLHEEMSKYHPSTICYVWALLNNCFARINPDRLASKQYLVRLLANAARSGNTEALDALGILLASSGNVEDKRCAALLLQSGCDQKDGLCANNLGVLYCTGNGVPKNLTQAQAWFEKAVSWGCDPSLLNIAICLAQEGDMQQHFPKIASSLIQASETGLTEALLYLWSACTSVKWNASLLANLHVEGQLLSRKSLSDTLRRHEMDANDAMRTEQLVPEFVFPDVGQPSRI